jgi:inner membrane protein
MASAFTHALTGLAIGVVVRPASAPARFWVLGAAVAALPDLDGIGFWLGVPYESTFGHRGFSHSLAFAAIVATVGLLAFPDRSYDATRPKLWAYLFLATASHGVLDAMTTGGGGVAFFAPIVTERYFFPWRPILVSPMSIRRFFSERGARVIMSEVVWVWIPLAVLVAMTSVVRWRSMRERDPTSDRSGSATERR